MATGTDRTSSHSCNDLHKQPPVKPGLFPLKSFPLVLFTPSAINAVKGWALNKALFTICLNGQGFYAAPPHRCKTETFVWTRAAGSSPTDPSWHIPFLNPRRSVLVNMWFLTNTAKCSGTGFWSNWEALLSRRRGFFFPSSYLFFNNTNSQDCLKDSSFLFPLSDRCSPHGSAIHLTLGATGIVKQSSGRLCTSSAGP